MTKHENLEVFCVCQNKSVAPVMLTCDECKYSMHPECLSVKADYVNFLKVFICPTCAPYSPTLFLLKKNTIVQLIARKYSLDDIVNKIEASEEIVKKLDRGFPERPEKRENKLNTSKEDFSAFKSYSEQRVKLLKFLIEAQAPLLKIDAWLHRHYKKIGEFLYLFFLGLRDADLEAELFEIIGKYKKEFRSNKK